MNDAAEIRLRGEHAREVEKLRAEIEELREQREQAETRGLELMGDRVRMIADSEARVQMDGEEIARLRADNERLQLRLTRIETVAEAIHNAFKPGARLPHEQEKALTDLAIALREQPADPLHRNDPRYAGAFDTRGKTA